MTRYTFPREFYRPKGSRVESPAGLPGAEIHRYESEGPNGISVPYAAVFGGKRAKPDWHFRFKSIESRESHIAEWIVGQQGWKKRQQERKQERMAPHDFKVGQLFVRSFGYDQTNIDFYKLVELKGSTMGLVAKISQTVNGARSSGPAEYVRPDPNGVIGEPKLKRLTKYGFSTRVGTASPCSADTERYQTAFGWGH